MTPITKSYRAVAGNALGGVFKPSTPSANQRSKAFHLLRPKSKHIVKDGLEAFIEPAGVGARIVENSSWHRGEWRDKPEQSIQPRTPLSTTGAAIHPTPFWPSHPCKTSRIPSTFAYCVLRHGSVCELGNAPKTADLSARRLYIRRMDPNCSSSAGQVVTHNCKI